MAFAGNLAVKMILIVSICSLMGINLVLRDVFIVGKYSSPIYYWLLFPAYIIFMPVTFFIPIYHARKVLLSVHKKMKDKLNEISRDINLSFEQINIQPSLQNFRDKL